MISIGTTRIFINHSGGTSFFRWQLDDILSFDHYTGEFSNKTFLKVPCSHHSLHVLKVLMLNLFEYCICGHCCWKVIIFSISSMSFKFFPQTLNFRSLFQLPFLLLPNWCYANDILGYPLSVLQRTFYYTVISSDFPVEIISDPFFSDDCSFFGGTNNNFNGCLLCQ